MASIYHNTYLAVAATVTRDGNEGFLSEKYGEFLNSIEPIDHRNGERSFGVSVRQKPPEAPHKLVGPYGILPLSERAQGAAISREAIQSLTNASEFNTSFDVLTPAINRRRR